MSRYLEIFESVACDISDKSDKRGIPSRAERAIRAWLDHIRETDPQTINEVLEKCATDREALAFFMAQATQVPAVRRVMGTTVHGVEVVTEGPL